MIVDSAIIQQHALANIDDPSVRSIERLQDWMERPDRGNIELLGQDRNIWSDTKREGLLVLKVVHRDDPISKWIVDRLLSWYYHNFGGDLPV